MSRRITTEEFIDKARRVHGDKYGYDKVEYVRNSDKVKMVCAKHGDFEQIPNHHLQGRGCPECGLVRRGKNCKNFYLNKRNWNFEQPEEYKLIPLTQGKFAKVDNEDFDSLKDINWHYSLGYAESGSLGKMHRVIMQAPNGMDVDHIIQENTLDNRKSNLRLATRSLNSANSQPRRGSSVYKGVSWNKGASKWSSEVWNSYKKYYLGLFTDEKEAGMAYDRKALELFGEFAYLNFPELKQEYLKELNYERL